MMVQQCHNVAKQGITRTRLLVFSAVARSSGRATSEMVTKIGSFASTAMFERVVTNKV